MELQTPPAVSDLKKHAGDPLNTSSRLLLSRAGAVTVAVTAIVGVLHVRPLAAQSAAADPRVLAFEVASVKPNKSGDTLAQMQPVQPGGRWTATNISLRLLIGRAYQLQGFQIAGWPSWSDSDRFDIAAKAESSFTGPQLNMMLQSLLAQRFKLAVHRETRDLPVYALVPGRSDGSLGPQLHRSTVDCAAIVAAALARRSVPAVPPPSAGPGRLPCTGNAAFPGHFVADGFSMLDITRNLQTFLGRIVLDRTGLTGTFHLTLNWTPDLAPLGPPPPGAPPLPPIDPNGPSIFTAVQEQLGLKLESQRGPVDVVVIDRVERPTPD